MWKNSLNFAIGGCGKSLVSILGLLFVFFFTTTPVFAETIGDSSYALSAALDGVVDVAIKPSASDIIATGSQDLLVSTTCPAGYDIYISMSGNDNKIYRNADNTSDDYVSPVAGTISSPSALGLNQWGFNITNSTTNFSQAPIDQTLIKQNGTGETRTKFTYGIKVGASLASGDYIGTVVYSVIPNPDCFETAFEKTFNNNGKTKMAANDGKSYYKMQDMNQAICDAQPTPSNTATDVPEITLVDSRDGETYTVRKLADGNCWMVDNLRLKLTANQALTSADTNVATDFTPTRSTQPSTTTSTSWGANNESSSVDSSRSYDTGNKDYGVYYNWYTATAGTGKYSSTANDATSSICPKGWQLPLNTGTKSYDNLITTVYGLTSSATGLTALQNAPFDFILSGRYDYSGSVRGQDSHGAFWSASPNTNYNAYLMYINSSDSSVSTKYRTYKVYGFSVRCVARDDEPENNSALTQALANAGAEYEKAADGKMYYKMQQSSSQITTACTNTATPAKTVTAPPEATLIDTRDKELYTIRKLADGNCWMAQNLRIVGSRTLTSADSDVSSNFTLPAAQTTAFANTSNNNQVGAISSDPAHGGGAYYSWYAATAGTGTAAMSSGNASSSICPKGWRLPLYSGNKSYQNLITTTYGIASSAAGSTKLQSVPLQFVLAGRYNTSGFVDGGSNGGYWSSSVYNASNAYRLVFSSSGVFPQSYYSEYLGYAIRCVAR